MTELGHISIFIALGASLLACVFGILKKSEETNKSILTAAGATFFAFLTLIWAFLQSDFSLALVVNHSHSLKPVFYKFAGTWGNHEGSMLLWCLITLMFGAVAVWIMKPSTLKTQALGVQAGLSFLSLAYLLFASSPFTRIDPAPFDGSGLNPLLQDPALAFHPPMLYLGYVGFSFVFSLAAAGMMANEVGASWAKTVRPWALFAWSCLTIGISLGGIWAYYELGWGGWWFWDPVENASLMPWLVGAALVHSIIVTQKRGSMASWTVFLSALTFCLSILGAFLVRSGVLTSVHAFALDPERGRLLLIGLLLVSGFAFSLFAWRGPGLKSGSEFDPVSREGALILNNLFLSVAAATVLVGTLYPLAIEVVTGEKISVGPPYFDLTLTPLMGLLFLAPPIAQAMTWRISEISPILKNLIIAAAIALAAGAAAFVLLSGKLWAVFGVTVGVWLICGTISDFVKRLGGGGLKRVFKMSLGVWGLTIAHIGLGIFVVGAVVETNGRIERTFAMTQGESVDLGDWTFTFNGATYEEGPNYFADRGYITAEKGSRKLELYPEKRMYPVSGTPTTEVAIRKSLAGDLYVALGDPIWGEKNGWTVRVSINPLIDFVFGGVALIALGGFMAFANQRSRSRSKSSSVDEKRMQGWSESGELAK